MEEFRQFLEANINQIHTGERSKIFKEGLSHSLFFEAYVNFPYDPQFSSRFMYVRNLCLNNPVPFEVCTQLSKFERALMYLSFNDISSALNVLEIPFSCEVTGTTAHTRVGAEFNAPVLKCTGTVITEQFPYTAEGYTYPDYTIEPLTYPELIYCYIKMVDILRNQDNDTLKKFTLKAYLNRVLEDINQLTPHFHRAFLIIQAEIENLPDKLEKIKDKEIPVDGTIFEYPITFKFDVLIRLGLAYKNRQSYIEAYDCFKNYPLYLERIDCLIGLRDSEKAAIEINSYIALICGSQQREDRMMLCGLYLKLAHLYQNVDYFDRAFEAFRCTKPLYMKGLYYFRIREFESAAVAFDSALELTPEDEKIKYSYACTLIELDRFAEATKILKELKNSDPMNEQISKNLSYCYHKQSDAESMLDTLRLTASGNYKSMQEYFILAIKYGNASHIRWALPRISSSELLRGAVNYLHNNKIMDKDELIEALKTNPHINFQDICNNL